MKKTRIAALSLAVLLIFLLAGVAGAGRSAHYAIDWQVLSGGGAPASAGTVSLNASLGQTAIGPSSSASYGLSAGYWLERGALAPGSRRLYLPLIFKNAVFAPDLVVDDLNATGSVVTVVIRNAGTAPVVDAFWVDVYFDPDQTPAVNKPWDAIAGHGVVWGVTTPIQPGGSLVLTNDIGDPYYFPGYSSPPPLPVGATIYALADSINYSTSYGAVQESDEGNNLRGPVVSIAGGEEPGSQPGQASSKTPSNQGLPPR
jgi:hypothetical protein